MHDNMSTLAWHTSELASQTKALQEQLRRSLEIHRNWNASRMCAILQSRVFDPQHRCNATGPAQEEPTRWSTDLVMFHLTMRWTTYSFRRLERTCNRCQRKTGRAWRKDAPSAIELVE